MTEEKFTAEYFDRLRKDLVISDTLKGNSFEFRTTWGLFSPKSIDNGTRLLLDHIEIRPDEQALDLGCGYGPIGLTIAHLAPEGHCTMVDKDFVAIEYARKNAALNQINNVDIFLSDGCNHLKANSSFSLVVTNLPAKTSKEHYYLFFYDAYQRMQPGARFYVVVINGLRKFIAKSFVEIFGNHKKIKQGQTYTVAMAIKEN
jgi:16S rRNA G1207 methylase RsmC